MSTAADKNQYKFLSEKQNYEAESGGGDYSNIKQNIYPVAERTNNNNDLDFHASRSKDEQKIDSADLPINNFTIGGNSASKGFSFVSVAIEPNKKGKTSMKKRDKNKPLIDAAVIQKQILFQNRLIEYQR